jgi:hypothetical protein
VLASGLKTCDKNILFGNIIQGKKVAVSYTRFSFQIKCKLMLGSREMKLLKNATLTLSLSDVLALQSQNTK